MNIPNAWQFALAAGLLTGSAIASSESFALALADVQPELAVRLNGDQSDALSNLAALSLGATSGDSPDNGRDAAQRAIAIDPFDVQAAAHLGMLSQLDDDQATARRIMNYAQMVSRRDTTVQFWWIEHWARRGDVVKILRHYDTALRTSSQAPSTLFPILVSAVGNPIVSRQLAETLDNNALWTDQFVQQFAQSSPDDEAISGFFKHLAATDFIVSELAISTAISRLVESGNAAQAFELYTAYYPEKAKPLIRNASFGDTSHLPTAFDWTLAEAGFYVGLGQSGLQIDAPASVSGPVAHQITRLSAGDWEIRLEHDGGATGSERLALDLVCMGDAVDLQPVAAREDGVVRTQVRIPVNCDHQRLTISLRSSAAGEAFEINRLVSNRL